MGSGASKSGSGKAQHDEASSKQSSETRTSKTLVKRGSVERKSNGSPETPRSSKRESSMKRGNQAMDDTRGSSIRAMRGTVNKRGSFAEHEGMDGDAAKGGMSTRPSNSKSGRFDRHSIGAVTGRTSVISVHRPGSTPSGPTPRQDRHSMGTMSTVKVSRSIDAKTFMQTQREREQNRNIVGTDPGTGGSGEGRRKSRKEPSRHSLQMIHQSRQSVISLQDPNAPDVKRRMQLEEQIKRERLNKKMKSIVTVQLLRKLLDDDLGVKLRKSIPSSIVRQVPQQKRAEFKSLLAGAAEATSADDAGTTALRAFVKDVNTAHVEKLVELAEGPPLKSLGDVKTEISRASHMLSEGRVAFEVFGAGYPSEMLSSSDVPPCNQLGLMESDPWAICRALGSVDAQRHLIESKSSTIGATLLGRHLLQLSMVLTNIGNQARVNAVILIHCSNEHVDLITNDLLSHSHYGFLKENVVLVPTPPMPSFTVRNEHDAGDGGADSDAGADAPAGSCGEDSKTDEVAEKKRNEIEAAKMLTVKPGLSRSYYGNGYGMLQLSWPGQGMLVINNEQRRSRIGPSLLNYLEDHGVQMVVASNINDLDKLMMPGALSLKLLSVVNDAFNEHVDKVDVANVFLEVTTDSASTSNAATDLVFDVEGKVRVLSPERMAKGVRERLCAKGGSEQLPVSCGRWYFSLTTLEKKIIPALSEMLPRLTVGDTVEGFGVGVSFSLEDLTLEMHQSGDGGGDEVNAGAGADAADHESGSGGNGLVIDLIRFDQASVSFRSESDVESAVAVLAEQDENQDFVNMGVKCNFGKKQVSGRVTSLFHRPRIMAMLCINDQAAIRPLRFLENAMSKNMDRLTLAYVMEGERETERESLARANFEQFKTWSPEVNINALMIVKREKESIEQTICRYAAHEKVDLIACGSKALNAENVASCSVVETLKTTGCSVLVSKSGIRSKNLLESTTMGHGHTPTGRQSQGLNVSILVDEHFEECLRFTMNFFNDKEKDTLSLLRLTKRSDLPDQTLEHFRVVQRCEQLCCASQCAIGDDCRGGGIGLVSVVNNVLTTIKDASGNGTNEVSSHVQNNEVGLLVIALPKSDGVSEFVTDMLVKSTCPILFVRPSGK